MCFLRNRRIRSRSLNFSVSFLPIFLLFFFLPALYTSCTSRIIRLERKLGKEDAEFLYQVDYIMTRKERKIFLELPDSEREQFKEDFWKRRDPTPDTEENEFRTEYYNRLEAANELFRDERKEGYLTDRGRIYILFGPPQIRDIHLIEDRDPLSPLYMKCGEVWHYGRFPVVFVDSNCTGNYRLATYDLSPFRNLDMSYGYDVEYLHDLSQRLALAQETFLEEKDIFDFSLDVKKISIEPNRAEAMVMVEVPYKGIWFKAEDEWLKTTLELHLELKDFEGRLIWDYDGVYEVKLRESELKEKRREKYKIEVPLSIEAGIPGLRQGKNKLSAVLKNRTGDEELKKVIEFDF